MWDYTSGQSFIRIEDDGELVAEIPIVGLGIDDMAVAEMAAAMLCDAHNAAGTVLITPVCTPNFPCNHCPECNP